MGMNLKLGLSLGGGTLNSGVVGTPFVPFDSSAVAIGDSLTTNGFISSANYDALYTYGYFAPGSPLSGGRLKFLSGTNKGVGGEKTADIVARLAAINAVGAKVAFVLAGINDILSDIPTATTTANLTTIYNSLLANGAQCVIALCVFPTYGTSTLSAGRLTLLADLNSWIRSRNSQTIRVVDATSVLDSIACYYDNGVDNGLHLNAVGAARVARVLGPIVKNAVLDGDFAALITGAAYKNNPTHTGTGGTLSNGALGTAAANWILEAGSMGGGTLTGSKDGSDNQIVTLSGNYSGSTRDAQFFTDLSTGLPAGSTRLEVLGRMQIMGALTGIASIFVRAIVYTSGFATLGLGEALASDFTTSTQLASTDGILNFRTPSIAIAAGTPAHIFLGYRITLKDSVGSTPVSGAFKLLGAAARASA